MSNKIYNLFENNAKIESFASACIGMNTGNNNLFVREWSEVSFNNLGLEIEKKWFSGNGDLRKSTG